MENSGGPTLCIKAYGLEVETSSSKFLKWKDMAMDDEKLNAPKAVTAV